jgi:hypothetical protein
MSLLRFIKYFTWEKRVFLFKKSNLTSQLLEKFANSVDLTRGRHAYMILFYFIFYCSSKLCLIPFLCVDHCFFLFHPKRGKKIIMRKLQVQRTFIHSFILFLFILFKQWFFFYHNPGSSYKSLSWSTMQFSIRKLKNNI